MRLFDFFKLALTSLACLLNHSSMADVQQFPEFKSANINGATGALFRSDKTLRLTNNASGDGLFFVFQEIYGNGHIIARVNRSGATSGKIGLVFRENTKAISTSAGVFLTSSNTIFERVNSAEKSPTLSTLTDETHEWLRVVREGNAFSAFHSADGTNWIQFSADTIEMPEKIFAGFAVIGVEVAEFQQVQMTSAQLISPVPNSHFVIPTNILLEINVSSLDGKGGSAEFYTGATKIGATQSKTFYWSNALAATHSVSARVITSSGAEFFTEPVECKAELPPASAAFVGVDSTTEGNWIKAYGKDGFNIIYHATNYPPYAEVSSKGHKGYLVNYVTNTVALQLTNHPTRRIAAHWFTYTNMTVSIGLLDGHPRRVSFYCQDWGSDARVQKIEVINENNAILDTRRVAQFANGKYYTWDIRGRVNFRISRIAGGPTALCGIFFDPVPTSSVKE